jgi:hypothetical protein
LPESVLSTATAAVQPPEGAAKVPRRFRRVRVESANVDRIAVMHARRRGLAHPLDAEQERGAPQVHAVEPPAERLDVLCSLEDDRSASAIGRRNDDRHWSREGHCLIDIGTEGSGNRW